MPPAHHWTKHIYISQKLSLVREIMLFKQLLSGSGILFPATSGKLTYFFPSKIESKLIYLINLAILLMFVLFFVSVSLHCLSESYIIKHSILCGALYKCLLYCIDIIDEKLKKSSIKSLGYPLLIHRIGTGSSHWVSWVV